MGSATVKIAIGVASVGLQIAMAAMSGTQGPRLGDLSISAATYGLPIAKGWGSVRLGGNMIWTSGFKEAKHRSGKISKMTNYSYSASFAFAFAAGPCARILRIWADAKLVYDETGEKLGIPGVIIRQYYGTETQMPDPAIAAAEGVANTPAFRGLVYIVADNVQLEPFGNRIPNISAEVAFAGEALNTVTLATFPVPVADAPAFAISNSQLWTGYACDWSRNVMYYHLRSSTAYGIGVIQLATMESTLEVTLAEMYSGTAYTMPPLSGYSGQLITLDATSGTDLYALITTSDTLPAAAAMVRINPESMRVTGSVATVFHIGLFGSLYGLDGCVTRVLSPTADTMTVVAYNLGSGAQFYDGTNMALLGAAPTANFSDSVFTLLIPGFRDTTLGASDFWFIQTACNEGLPWLDLWCISVPACAPRLLRLACTTIVPTGLSCVVQRADYDAANDALLLWVGVGTAAQPYGQNAAAIVISVNPESGAVNWQYQSPNTVVDGKGSSLLTASTVAWVDSNYHIVMLDTRTGAVLQSQALTPAASPYWFSIYNSVQEDIYNASLAIPIEQIKLGRGAAKTVALKDIVSDICVEAGLAPLDLDVAALTDQVRGYTHVQETARTLLTDLAAAYFFDGVESEYCLKFVKRGGAPVVVLPYMDFLPGGNAAALGVIRNQAEDLPRRLWVRYADFDNSQQQGTQHFARAAGPVPYKVINAAGEITMDLRLVYTADEAKTLAKRRLLMLWAERETIQQFGLPPGYLALDPADVVTVTQRDGATMRLRLEQVTIGADMSLQLSGTVEDATLLALTASGSTGLGVTPTLIPTPYAVVAIAPELPLLRDSDDLAGLGLRQYAAFGAYSGQTFGGAVQYVSADAISWDPLFSSQTAMSWGVAVNALPAPISPWATDTQNYLDVAMATGGENLATATYAQILEGANPALLTSSGAAELVQYTTVTPLGGSIYRLSGLVRGRRGTEHLCGLHQSGDRFVLLDPAFGHAAIPLGWLGLTRYEKSLGALDGFDTSPTLPRVFAGTAEKPYAPIQITGVRDLSNNLTIAWKRRTRITSEWRDLTEATALNEASESYAVDIYAAGAVVRTLTASTPSVVYAVADQITDGLDTLPVALAVYQISAVVGRGFPATITLADPLGSGATLSAP